MKFSNEYDDVIRILVKGGAKLDVVEKTGKTPLICAAAKGAVEVVEFLAQFGADRSVLDHAKVMFSFYIRHHFSL